MFHRYLHALWRMTGLSSPSGPRGPGIDYVRLVTVALIPAIALLNALVPSDVVLNSLLVTPPALAAASWSAMGTGAVGLASLAVDMALSGYQGDLGTRATWVTACVIVVVTLTAMYVSRVRQQREATLAAVRKLKANDGPSCGSPGWSKGRPTGCSATRWSRPRTCPTSAPAPSRSRSATSGPAT